MQEYLGTHEQAAMDFTPVFYVLAGVVAVIGLALLCVMNYQPY